MTAPIDIKSVKVSTETHRRIHALATELGTTADGALAYLLGSSTVRVPVSDAQLTRWNAAADALGLTVEEFVRLRVEAALALGTDPVMIHRNIERIGATVDAIRAAAGIPSTAVHRPSTARPPKE